MKKEKSEKKQWWLFFLTFGSFSAIWFFVFYLINKQLNYSEDTLFFFTPSSAYWVFFLSALVYGLTTWGMYVSIKGGFRERSLQEFKLSARLVVRLAMIPLLISLPFLYLGITNSIIMTTEKITLSPFWSFSKKDYFWDGGVTAVEIDYSLSIESNPNRTSFNGRYILHFEDGKKIDIWQDTLEGGIEEVKEIDSFIQTKYIPFFVRRVPSEETINKFFSENADFIRELYSR